MSDSNWSVLSGGLYSWTQFSRELWNFVQLARDWSHLGGGGGGGGIFGRLMVVVMPKWSDVSVGCMAQEVRGLRWVFVKERSSLPPLRWVGLPLLRRQISSNSSSRKAMCSPSSLVGDIELSMGWWALKSPPIKILLFEAKSSPSSSVVWCCLYMLYICMLESRSCSETASTSTPSPQCIGFVIIWAGINVLTRVISPRVPSSVAGSLNIL